MILRRLDVVVVALAGAMVLAASGAKAADRYEAMAKCYPAEERIETRGPDGKVVTTYKDHGREILQCNAKVVEQARGESKVADILRWADVIGAHSMWQHAMPVYTLAAKADASKATCKAKDPLYALDLALSAPADNPTAVASFAFLDACWPTDRDTLIDYLSEGGYVTDNACKFLALKRALPEGKKSLCAGK